MIDRHYIETAIKIRKDYLDMSKKLDECSVEITNISNQLMSETELLDELKENLEIYNSPEEAQVAIFSKLNDIDVHAKRINSIYKPINDRIDELSEQESILYDNIRRKYPELSQEEIVDIINKHISK